MYIPVDSRYTARSIPSQMFVKTGLAYITGLQKLEKPKKKGHLRVQNLLLLEGYSLYIEQTVSIF